MRSLASIILLITFVQWANSAPSIDSRPPCGNGKLDLVLVVDVSGSAESRFIVNRDIALDIAQSMPISDDQVQIAIVQYSRLATTRLEFGSGQTFEQVNASIFSMEWTGGVALSAEAVDLGMIQYRRSRNGAARAMVLITDGNSYNLWKDVLAAAERLRYSDAIIYAVALGGSSYEPELRQYVGANGTIARRKTEFDQVKRELLDLSSAKCRVPGAPAPRPINSGSGSKEIQGKGPLSGSEQLVGKPPGRRPSSKRVNGKRIGQATKTAITTAKSPDTPDLPAAPAPPVPPEIPAAPAAPLAPELPAEVKPEAGAEIKPAEAAPETPVLAPQNETIPTRV